MARICSNPIEKWGIKMLFINNNKKLKTKREVSQPKKKKSKRECYWEVYKNSARFGTNILFRITLFATTC